MSFDATIENYSTKFLFSFKEAYITNSLPCKDKDIRSPESNLTPNLFDPESYANEDTRIAFGNPDFKSS